MPRFFKKMEIEKLRLNPLDFTLSSNTNSLNIDKVRSNKSIANKSVKSTPLYPSRKAPQPLMMKTQLAAYYAKPHQKTPTMPIYNYGLTV